MLTVYPNPTTSGDFSVEASFDIKSIQVYTITGNLLYQTEIYNLKKSHVPVELNKGIYVVKVIGNTYEYSTKLIVN
jgi:hypothetical protein